MGTFVLEALPFVPLCLHLQSVVNVPLVSGSLGEPSYSDRQDTLLPQRWRSIQSLCVE